MVSSVGVRPTDVPRYLLHCDVVSIYLSSIGAVEDESFKVIVFPFKLGLDDASCRVLVYDVVPFGCGASVSSFL
jgi:hypothetical protein